MLNLGVFVLAQADPVGSTRPSSAMFGYPNLQMMGTMQHAGNMSQMGTMNNMGMLWVNQPNSTFVLTNEMLILQER